MNDPDNQNDIQSSLSVETPTSRARGMHPNSIRNLKRYESGQCGNPSGRPRGHREVAELARSHSVEAIQVLVRIMLDASAPPRDRSAAAIAILDRAYGKPQVEMTLQSETSLRVQLVEVVRSHGVPLPDRVEPILDMVIDAE